jgi:ankyrin repeat protein
MNLNQVYNKSILLKAPTNISEEDFNLNSSTYNGKLTMIADHFNKLSINDCEKLTSELTDSTSSLQVAGYLGFSNIFLYLLTYNADPYHIDSKGQSLWHMLFYKGHTKVLWLLLNYERYKLKMESIAILDNIKKSYGFSKLDIVKGKLSKAVNMTETNLKKFTSLQLKLKEETQNILKKNLEKLQQALGTKDKEGRTPLHYAAMSKFPLCYLIINDILNFDFFKMTNWEEFLKLFQDIQSLEVKDDRIFDPRKSQRLERELLTLMGDDIIKSLSKDYKKLKNELMKKIINSEDNLGDTVLHIAAFHGDYRIVNSLIEFGGDKTKTNLDGKMPVDMAKDDFVRRVLTNLNKAAKMSDEKNVTELIHFGHNINDRKSIFSQAPIHKIIESNKEDKYRVLKKMLDMGADPNIRDSNGWTALHYASQFGDFESVKILIENKAMIDAYSNNHRTALHFACSMYFPKIVKFLLENNSDADFKDHLGCTPLHLSAKSGNVECLNILLAYGAKLYEEDFRKWNILHYAAFQGHHRAVRFICKYDADFDILQTSRNSQNKLAIEIVRDPSVKPFFISLWHAARDGDLDMTRQLLNDGENINELTTFLKNTPLHLAVFNNHYLLVRLLLENRAEVDIRNADGVTSQEYADIINHGVSKLATSKSEEIMNENCVVDFRIFVRNAYTSNKSEKILNSTVCKENWKVRLWNVFDFNNKIKNLLTGNSYTENFDGKASSQGGKGFKDTKVGMSHHVERVEEKEISNK